MSRWVARHLVLLIIAMLASSSVVTAQRARSASSNGDNPNLQHSVSVSTAGYQATRLLVARSARLNKVGWLEATTTFRPGHGLTYTVIAEGGDKGIRNRVLRKVLDNEVEMSAPARAPGIAISDANYDIARDGDRRTWRLAPRRREVALIDGIAHVDARGRLMKLEGRLAKSPSFWVRSISVRRTYQPVAGHALPVLVESVADVKLAGACEFSMWIDYTAVDGQRVERQATRPRPSPAEPSALLVALQQQRLR